MNERANHDPQWVKSVVERFERPLLLYVLRQVGGNEERARDIVQDAFLKLCKQPRAAVEDHLAEWLYSVSRNLVIDGRRKERGMVELDDETVREAEAAASPEREAERIEQANRMMKLLEGLPGNQQEVLRLKFQAGLSYKEISSITKLTVTNVGFLIHTGLKTLRAQMTEDARVVS